MHRRSFTTGFVQTSKSFFHDFPGHVPFTNVSCMRPKKCIYKISYQCIRITVIKRKCNTCGYIMVFQWTQISPAKTNNPRNEGWFTIPGISRILQDLCPFPGLSRAWNSEQQKFQDFPGSVRTLFTATWRRQYVAWSSSVWQIPTAIQFTSRCERLRCSYGFRRSAIKPKKQTSS